MTDPQAVVARFHDLLVREIRSQRPEYLDGPFTVAEIYQNLVPYSSHRDRLGVEMNGDYEDALLRLLAGEGEYLILDSEAALRELREELETPNPNTSIYREFAAVDVRLNPAARAQPPGPSPGTDPGLGATPPPIEPAPGTDDGPGADPPAVSVVDLAPASAPPAATVDSMPAMDTPHEAAEPSDKRAPCKWCRAELPARHNLSFCLFCGGDVNVVPCPHCAEELEPEWRFCIACGVEVEP